MAAIQLDECDRTLSLGRNLYRSSSPGTSRLENRVKELEEHLDEERALRLKVERELNEVNAEFDGLNNDLRSTTDQVVQQDEAIKRREQDYNRIRRELDGVRESYEENINNVKRRHQCLINELTAENATIQKAKVKAEKEKAELARELEKAFAEVEEANKAKLAAQNKQETLEAQLIRIRSNYEDAQKRIGELNLQNLQLTSEIGEQTRNLERLNASLTTAQRAQSTAECVADDHKKALDEESKTRLMLQNKLNSLQQEIELLTQRADEESDNAEKYQTQVTKLTAELAQTRSKFERELNEKNEEFDELKRRLNTRVNELTESLEIERGRVISLERAKTQLSNQCQELQVQVDSICAEHNEQTQLMKTLESQKEELEQLLEEAQTEESNLRTKSGLLQRDLIQVRAVKCELEERVTVLERENKQNSEKLKETKERLSTLNRQVTDLECSRGRLEAEREHLDTALKETEDALHTFETKYQATYTALSALRTEYERQSRDKEEELESCRRSSSRNLENLKMTIADMESKHQNEIDRLKKKLELNVASLESQLEEEKVAHIETNKALEDAELHIHHLENELNEANNLVSETATTLQLCENRRSALSNELDTMKSQLEVSERLKRKLEEESSENMSSYSALSMQVNNLSAERRKLEGQIAILEGDIDDITGARDVAIERADRLQNELTKIAQELQVEQEAARRADIGRRHLENELKECNNKILDSRRAAETAERDAEDARNQCEQKVRELQMALEDEAKKTREAQNQLRKSERSLKESMQAEEDAGRMINELRDMVDRAQSKLKQTRRQLEEAESAAQTANMKYRRAQQQIDDVDLRAQLAERRLGNKSNEEDNGTVYSIYRRQRGSTQYLSRARTFSTTREGSVYSVMSELPSSSTYKARFHASGGLKSTKRYEADVQHGEIGSTLSLLDLPPADTNGS